MHCSLEIPEKGTVTIQTTNFEPHAGPAQGAFSAYFVNVTGTEIDSQPLKNIICGTSNFQLGQTSSLLSYSQLQQPIPITEIPFGDALTVEVFGVAPQGCVENFSPAKPSELFYSICEVPHVYLLATKQISFKANANLSLSSSYNPNTPPVTAAHRNCWVPMTNTNAPTGRWRQRAVFVPSKNKMIVWGGRSSSGTLNTGGIYDIATNSWSSLSSTNAPSAREFHVAVYGKYAGSDMIVWGEGTTGGKYDLDNNTWAAITTNGQPNEAGAGVAISDDTSMWVWRSEQGGTSSGGNYFPETNEWSSMITTNQPSARSGYGGAFFLSTTDDRLVVWGGHDGASHLANGAIYNASIPSWTTVSSTGAPSARMTHAVAGVGSTFIVWGGHDGSFLNSGALLDVVNNSWKQATTTTNAPTARRVPLVASTGTRMVIWAGEGSGGPLATGAIYDSTNDSWETVSSTGAPSARQEASAVWTGSRMIVWGGDTGGGNSTNDGAIYVP